MAVAPAVLTAITIAGTVAAAGSALVSASASADAKRYQASVADRQRQINELNAKRAVERSRIEAMQADQQSRALLGEQIAAQSASGLKIGGRSQILTRKSAKQLARQDALNIAYGGDIEAYNYRQAAQDAGIEAKFLRNSAGYDMLAGWLDAGSTLMGGMKGFDFGTKSTLGTRKIGFGVPI